MPPVAPSPGSRKVVLVAMLISCRCSSVSVWKRRMEEPEEKAIHTPLPAFTMCVTLTASSWCASKLCCGRERKLLGLGRLRRIPRHALPQPLPQEESGWQEKPGSQGLPMPTMLAKEQGGDPLAPHAHSLQNSHTVCGTLSSQQSVEGEEGAGVVRHGGRASRKTPRGEEGKPSTPFHSRESTDPIPDRAVSEAAGSTTQR